MDMLRKLRATMMLAVVLIGLLVPATAFSLERPPGTPTVIILDGRTEPPISVSDVKAQVKPKRAQRVGIVVSFFGVRVLITPHQALILLPSR